MNSIPGRIRIEESTQLFQEVFWEIEDLERQLGDSVVLGSEAFSFGGHFWRLLLQTVEVNDARYMDGSLSRVDIPNQHPLFPTIWWHMGIIDRDREWHYDRSGWAKLVTPCPDWTPVADWTGPEWTHLTLENDLFIPDDNLTVAVQLSWNPAFASCIRPEGLSNKGSIQKAARMPGPKCDVTLKVMNRTFRTHKMVLELFVPVMAAMLYPSKTDGEDEVAHLADCKPEAFETFLSFLYSGKLHETTCENVMQVYHIAAKYVVTGLKQKCVQRLLNTMNADSVCGILAVADEHGDEELSERATEFFVKNARDIFRTTMWLDFMVTNTKLANDLIILSYERASEPLSKTVQ